MLNIFYFIVTVHFQNKISVVVLYVWSNEETVICRVMGERYRREMLAHGGSKEPTLMVQGKNNTFL